MKKLFILIFAILQINILANEAVIRGLNSDITDTVNTNVKASVTIITDTNNKIRGALDVNIAGGNVTLDGSSVSVPTYITNGDGSDTLVINDTGQASVTENSVYSIKYDTQLSITTTEDTINLLIVRNDVQITSDTDILVGVVTSGSYGDVCWEKNRVIKKDVQTLYIKKKLTGGSATVWISTENRE